LKLVPILGGAKDRLLPASVPFRFFAAATGFHVLAWLALFAGAEDLPGFIGGPGHVLAALHLLTLGVLVMTAIGASLQLLPVATRQPLVRVWPARMVFWLFAPGTLVLAVGMIGASPTMLLAGGLGVCAGLLVFAVLMTDNLLRAASMPIVAGHGWGALAALIGFAGLGLALVVDFDTGFLPDRQTIAAAHMVLATFGFMGLLAFGFSHVLVPMFAMSRALPARDGWLELGLALAAIALAVVGILVGDATILSAGVIFGLAAGAVYLWLMRTALRTRMRKRLGLSFAVMRASWALMMLGLATGLAVLYDVPVPNGATLFGFLVLAGWLLTFLMAVLQRIMPFLASMHATGKGGMPPLLSELTAERPLKVHAVFHAAALILCSAGIVLDAPVLVQLGVALGVVGAIAFAMFAGSVVTRLNRASTAEG
jgi:hypothetical protein